MNTRFVAGGLYGDHLPSGAWCVLIPKAHCVTHLGIVPFPDGETFGPLFVRCTDVDGFRFAGQAHDSENPAAYERIGSAWVSLPPPCFGVSPLIYDRDGNLHCSNGSVGSQGYRYVTPQNQLISGDATYGPFHGLFEYTYLEDGLWIGQGADDGSGIRVWDGTTLRQLELGTCRFLRANRAGDVVALAFTRPEGVALISTTMAELRALPPVVQQKPDPKIPPDDRKPPPDDKKEPTMQAKQLPDDVHAIVVAIHSRNLRLATGSDDDRRALQKKICETVRARKGPSWGWKSNHGIGLANAKDAIAQLPDGAVFTPNQRQPLYIWDLFNGGTREPHKQPVMSETEFVEQFFVPVDPVDHLTGAEPQPDPVKPPPGDKQPPADLAPLAAELAKLKAEFAQFKEGVAELLADVEALGSRPVIDQAAVGGAVAAALEGYEVSGKTATSFGHQHTVKLRLTVRNP